MDQYNDVEHTVMFMLHPYLSKAETFRHSASKLIDTGGIVTLSFARSAISNQELKSIILFYHMYMLMSDSKSEDDSRQGHISTMQYITFLESVVLRDFKTDWRSLTSLYFCVDISSTPLHQK
uniref:Uncharacterized protein n=1 Tax=Arundo donax TaxID=35708 RepID=A0A0A9HB67_ARUDO